MKKYSIEIFFDRDKMNKELDNQPVTGEYDEETETIQVVAQNLEEVKKKIKSDHPTSRYLHLIDIDDLGV